MSDFENAKKRRKSYKNVVDLETAAKFFKDEILSDVKKILGEKYEKNLKEEKMPTQEDLVITGFSGFLTRINRIKIKYNDVLRELGYDVSHDYSRWEHIVDIETAVNAFKVEVLPEIRKSLKKNYGKVLKEGEYPTTTELKRNGFGGYLGRLTKKLKITYIDIIKQLSYPISYDYYRWRHTIDLVTAAKSFEDEVLPEVKKFLKKKSGKVLQEGEAPTYNELQEGGFGGYITCLNRINIKYNDVLNKIGYDLSYDPNRWRHIIDIETAASIFNEEILPEMRNFLKEELGKILKEEEMPTYHELVQGGFSGYLTRLNRFLDITYNDVLRKAGHTTKEGTEITDIGTELHYIIEWINMKHTRENKFDSYYEVYPSKHVSQIHPDMTLIVNEFLRGKLKLSNKIKIINIDFSMAFNNETLIDKSNRGYQGEDRILFIIPWTRKSRINTPSEIPFRKNVKILNPWEYAEFIGLKGENLEMFIKAFELAQGSIYNTTVREELNRLAIESLQHLKDTYPSMQEKFETKLKKLGLLNLLNTKFKSKKIGDYFNQ